MAATEKIDLRVSPEDKAEIERRAEEAGLSVSAYVLGAALKRNAPSRLGALERRIRELEAWRNLHD